MIIFRKLSTHMHLFEFRAELVTFFYSNIKLKEWLTRTCCILVAQSCLTLCSPMDCSTQASLSNTISQSLPKFMSIALGIPSNHLILWHRLLHLPSVFPSIRDFYNKSVVHIRWQNYWSFSFSISPSGEYSRLTSLKIGWLVWSPCCQRDSQESSPGPH